MESFKEYVNAGAFLNTTWSGLANLPYGPGDDTPGFPTPTMEIPTKSMSGRIRSIFYTKNPISIVLENGAVWKVTKTQWDYLVSIGKEPREGVLAQIDMNLDGTIKSVVFS